MLVSFSVFPQGPSRLRRALIVCSAAAAVAVPAQALERVTLRNGFTVECSRHDIVGDHVRVYSGKSSDNYQDLPLLQIAGIETLPDPPAPAPTPAPTVVAKPASPDLQDLLIRAGNEHNIDVELLASVIKAESGFHARAVSHAGARGLMQLMPGTARELGVHDAFRADQNIAGGTAYLDALLKRYHDNLILALAAYNAGPAAVERYHGLPPFRETRLYVARVINEFARRKQALEKSAKIAKPAAPKANTQLASR